MNNWAELCDEEIVPVDRGIAVIVDKTPIAVFRLSPSSAGGTEHWLAVDHVDPVTGAPVIARGLVGSTNDGRPTVASPLHKERYDLETGRRCDGADNARSLRTFTVRRSGDLLEINVDDGGRPAVRRP